MKPRIFVIHGWDAAPEREWFPWLKAQLAAYDCEVHIPAMPNTEYPVIEAWVGALREAVGDLRDSDIFVGHSIGCQTIMRYFEHVQGGPVRGFICVAGWFTLMGLENEIEERIAQPWLEQPIDLDRVRAIAGPVTAIFSDTDPYVPLEYNRNVFADRLGARIVIEHNKGHFSEVNDIYELPIVRDLIVELI